MNNSANMLRLAQRELSFSLRLKDSMLYEKIWPGYFVLPKEPEEVQREAARKMIWC